MLKFLSYVLIAIVCPWLGALVGLIFHFATIRLFKSEGSLNIHFILIKILGTVCALWAAIIIFNFFGYEITRILFLVVAIGVLAIEYSQHLKGRRPHLRSISITGTIIGLIVGFFIFFLK